ncbi:MAG TPA: hypothetical protein VGE60_02015 [Telluria sp.]
MKKKIVIVGAILSLAAGIAAAQESAPAAARGFGIGLKAGTAGAGLDLTRSFGDKFKLRVGYSTYEYSTELTEEDVDYDADLRLGGFNLLADYHPWSGGFRLTAGGYGVKHRVGGIGKFTGPESTIVINDQEYSSNELKDVTLDAKWKGFRPYLGLGYDGFNSSKAGLFFTADAGVILSGEPSLRINATCVNPEVCAAAAADIATEENRLRDDISGAKYLPVIQVGLGYRF